MINVLKPGFYSSIQDGGRFGYQDYGVPISGAMDKKAFHLANALLGNDENLPALELTMTGCKLEFDCSTRICITGANMNPIINGVAFKNNKPIVVGAGDELNFGKLESGFRAYLAVMGGFKTEIVMGSSSMYKGVTKDFILKKGDFLDIKPIAEDHASTHSSIRASTSYITNSTIEVYKGLEFHLLSKEQQALLFNNKFTISKDNNRMAYQLEEPLENTLKPIITAPVLPGTVQLTPSGKLIVLMRDCQTTGGYPRILQLQESAINTLSQKYTGNNIRLKLINF